VSDLTEARSAITSSVRPVREIVLVWIAGEVGEGAERASENRTVGEPISRAGVQGKRAMRSNQGCEPDGPWRVGAALPTKTGAWVRAHEPGRKGGARLHLIASL